MHLQEYQCVGMFPCFWIFWVGLLPDLSFSGMTIISGKPLLRTFKPHIHSWFQAHIFLTNKSHPRSCLNRATWEHEKNSQKPFLGIFEQVPGNIAKSSWEPKFIYMAPNSRKEQFPGTFHGTRFLHGIKRRFPQCSQEHSQESKPQVPGTCVQPARGRRGGLETAQGTLGQPRSFIGRLGVFVMSLWQCWLIQFDLLDSKLRPFHDQYADAKQHCDHANPKIAFQFARAAIWNLSRHGHRNLDKESTIINTARMRSWDCHKSKVSGKFQKFIWFYLEKFLLNSWLQEVKIAIRSIRAPFVNPSNRSQCLTFLPSPNPRAYWHRIRGRRKSEVSKRGWWTEGVGARKSFICQRFRSLKFSVPFSVCRLRRRGHISGELFWLFLGFVCRQPPPGNPFSKPLKKKKNASSSLLLSFFPLVLPPFFTPFSPIVSPLGPPSLLPSSSPFFPFFPHPFSLPPFFPPLWGSGQSVCAIFPSSSVGV